MTAGYSGTPLAKKLGIKPGYKISVIHAPNGYFELFSDLPDDLEWIDDPNIKKDLIHYFSDSRNQLEKDIEQLRDEIEQQGSIWVSWPKKSSKVETDLDGNVVRELGLNHGLVDIKVCAVSEIWSGLKFVIPVKDRK